MSPDESGERPRGAEGEFEELLRRVPHERADAQRRAEARRAFLAAEGAGGTPSRLGGSERMGAMVETQEERAFSSWLAEREILLPAGEGVRSRARRAFLAALATQPVRQRRRSPLVRGLILALAAAAILAVTFFLPKPERWQVRLDGELRFADADYAPGEDAQLAVALEGAGRVETLAARARFSFGNVFDVELLPDSSIEFPVLPELDGVSALVFEVHSGEAYVRTRAGYPGNPIHIRTPLAEVGLHGTTVGVHVDQACVCVCVADGTASVTGARIRGGAQAVTARSTLQVFTAGGEGKVMPFPAAEAGDEHTGALVEFWGGP